MTARITAGEGLGAVGLGAWVGLVGVGVGPPGSVGLGLGAVGALGTVVAVLGTLAVARGAADGGVDLVLTIRRETLWTVLAGGLLLGAATLVVAPELVLGGGLAATVADVGASDRTYVFVQAGGVAGLLVTAALALHAARGSSPAEVDVGDRRGGTESDTATPRSDLAAAVDALRESAGRGLDGAGRERRQDLETELHVAATGVLSRSRDVAPQTARRVLAAGEWTDDPRAASVFADDPPPVTVRLRDWIGFEPTSVVRARAALDELEAIADDGGVVDAGAFGAGDAATDSDPGALGGDEGATVTADEATEATGRVDPGGGDEDGGGHEDEPGGSDGDRRRVGTHGVGATAAVFALAAGYLAKSEAVLLMGAMAAAYAGLEYVATAPAPTVAVTRRVEASRPLPGDVIEVAVTIQNVGDRTLPDCRVVDGVPEAMPVVSGTVSTATALRPGESTTWTYRLRAKRGTFAFDPVTVTTRNAVATREASGTATVETPIRCSTMLEEFPTEAPETEQVGSVSADAGGSGIEFYATREYREGDPVNRIDWNRFAKTGELTTVEFRERRSATVVLVLDTRDVSRIAPAETELDAVDASVYAAERTFLALAELGVEVGAMTVGAALEDVRPGAGPAQRTRVQGLLRSEAESYDTLAGDGGRVEGRTRTDDPDVATVRRHLPSRSQVVLFSPCVDDYPVELVAGLRAAGHVVTVVSPAAVGRASIAQRTVALERFTRLRALRAEGATVLDWSFDEPVRTAVVRAIRRGGRG